MATLSRRSFVIGAGLAFAGLTAASASQARAGTLFDSLARMAQEAPDKQAPDVPAVQAVAAAVGDAYSDDEKARILLDAFLSFDFGTVLSQCAVEEYLDSGIHMLGSLAQLCDDDPASWPDSAPAVPAGATRALWATHLRGQYAATIARSLCRIAVDAAGIDISSFTPTIEEGVLNIASQLTALDQALQMLPFLEIEPLAVQKCTSLVDAVEREWLDSSYRAFELGRTAALARGAAGDLAVSVYRCLIGYQGEPLLMLTLPLCHYEHGWRLQYPCACGRSGLRCIAYTNGDMDLADAPDTMSDVELPLVSYTPEPATDPAPFASAGEAAEALLAALGVAGDGQAAATAQDFERLFCADAYLQAVDFATMYDVGDAIPNLWSDLDYLRMGTISTFLISGISFLPMRTPEGMRRLSGAMLATKHGALPLLNVADRCAKSALRASGKYAPETIDYAEAFSPLPLAMDPAMLDLGLAMYAHQLEVEEDVVKSRLVDDGLFGMARDYMALLNSFWADLGEPVALAADCGEMALTAAQALEGYYAGAPKLYHALLFDGSLYRSINLTVAPCDGGWRLADVELTSRYNDLVPMYSIIDGVSWLEGYGLDEVTAGLAQYEEQGVIEDLHVLRP